MPNVSNQVQLMTFQNKHFDTDMAYADKLNDLKRQEHGLNCLIRFKEPGQYRLIMQNQIAAPPKRDILGRWEVGKPYEKPELLTAGFITGNGTKPISYQFPLAATASHSVKYTGDKTVLCIEAIFDIENNDDFVAIGLSSSDHRRAALGTYHALSQHHGLAKEAHEKFWSKPDVDFTNLVDPDQRKLMKKIKELSGDPHAILAITKVA